MGEKNARDNNLIIHYNPYMHICQVYNIQSCYYSYVAVVSFPQRGRGTDYGMYPFINPIWKAFYTHNGTSFITEENGRQQMRRNECMDRSF